MSAQKAADGSCAGREGDGGAMLGGKDFDLDAADDLPPAAPQPLLRFGSGEPYAGEHLASYGRWDGQEEPLRFFEDFQALDEGSGPSMLNLAGDFYHEPDNVQRGVTMTVGLEGDIGIMQDFYRSKDVSRGVAFDAEMGYSSVDQLSPSFRTGEPYEFFDGKASHPTDPSSFSDLTPLPTSLLDLQKAADLPSEDFGPFKQAHSKFEAPAKEAAPSAFSDKKGVPIELPPFGNERTTLMFKGPSPAELANCVKSFLDDVVRSEIIKLRPAKLSLKAQVFREDGGSHTNCTLKVRVWTVPPSGRESQRLAVEFARRSGDAANFLRTYDEAAQFLRARFQADCVHSTAPVMPPPPLPSPPEEDEASAPAKLLVADTDCDAYMKLRTPLLDLADPKSESNKPVRAEAVAALAAAATCTGARVLLKLFASLGLDISAFLAGLLSSERLDVVYEASRLAAQVAPYVSDGDAGALLLTALKAVRAEKTSRLARLELADAVCSAAPGCPRERHLHDTLLEALSDFRGNADCREKSAIAHRLERALGNLNKIEGKAKAVHTR